MIACKLMVAGGQEWLESVTRLGRCALATFFVVALASPTQAQTFDQAISRALGTGSRANGPACSASATGNLNRLCNDIPPLAAASSSGSTTALSTENQRVEERKVGRLIGPVNLFISADYERFDKNVTTFEPGHRTNTGRTTVGADYSFSDRFLVGGAFKYGRDKGRFDAGGNFKTDSYGLQLYGNFVPATNSFVNASAGYTRLNSSIDRLASTTRVVTQVLGTVNGDTDANAFNVGVNGGYDFSFQGVTFGPRLGLHYKRTETDAYRERGSTGLELVYDAQQAKSLTSVLGLYGSRAISTNFGVLVPQATLEYVHEFQNSQRTINFRFVDNPAAGTFSFQNDRPDRNYFNIGVGIAAVWPHGISGFLNYRAMVGYNDRSSHTVTVGMRIEF